MHVCSPLPLFCFSLIYGALFALIVVGGLFLNEYYIILAFGVLGFIAATTGLHLLRED